MEQVLFAPGACEGIRAAAATANIAMDGDGCSEGDRAALIAFAEAKGPAGVDAALRAAAAERLREMDLASR